MLTRPQSHEAEIEAEATTHEAEAEAEVEAEATTHENAKKLITLGWVNTPQSTPSLLRNKNRSISFTVAR